MFKSLLSVFLESPCPFCQRTNPNLVCTYCLDKLSSQQFNPQDCPSWQEQVPLFAWGRYDGQLKRAIALLKYHHQPEIGVLLGQLLGKAWLASNLTQPAKISVIPIPLHPHKIKARGFNQATKIAHGFCQVTKYNLCPQGLIRVKNTQAMFELSPTARSQNIQEAFRLGSQFPKHPVLLLDDIHTTGATIQESAKVLQSHKIALVGSIVMAKAGCY